MKVSNERRAEIVVRDGGCCARCGASCFGVLSSIHHRLPRRMGGTRDPRSSDFRNLVLLCGSGTTGCHNDVESCRQLAYEDGWLIRSYDDLDKPMRTLTGAFVRLSADGERTDVILAAVDQQEES